MRRAVVSVRGVPAGTLTQANDGSFTFAYGSDYLSRQSAPPVSLTLPKRPGPFASQGLFPAFFQLLPEGHNKKILCTTSRIDPADEFSILLHVARFDTVGVVTVEPTADE